MVLDLPGPEPLQASQLALRLEIFRVLQQ